MSNEFWILWNPTSNLPPKVRFYTEAEARTVAVAMAQRHGEQFYVMHSARKPCTRCRAKDPEDGAFIQATIYDGGSTSQLNKLCVPCFEAVLRRLKGT